MVLVRHFIISITYPTHSHSQNANHRYKWEEWDKGKCPVIFFF